MKNIKKQLPGRIHASFFLVQAGSFGNVFYLLFILCMILIFRNYYRNKKQGSNRSSIDYDDPVYRPPGQSNPVDFSNNRFDHSDHIWSSNDRHFDHDNSRDDFPGSDTNLDRDTLDSNTSGWSDSDSFSSSGWSDTDTGSSMQSDTTSTSLND